MFRTKGVFFSLFALSVLILATARPAAAQGKSLGHANGGGFAVFDDPSNPFFGATTTFSVGANFYESDMAEGHFECVAAGLLNIHVTIEFGHINPDGTAQIGGMGIVRFESGIPPAGATFTDFFIVTLTPGGPGVGHFTFFGPVWNSSPPRGPDDELVTDGQIKIH